MQGIRNRLIGLLGGTFNPIHNGHLHFAQSVLQQLDLDEVRFIPSASPPLKAMPQVSAKQRAEMVALTIAKHPKLQLDRRELSRAGHSYTIDTLKSLRADFGEQVSLCWLIGTDAFAKLDTWRDWQQLFNYAHFVVVNRPQAAPPVLTPALQSVVDARLTPEKTTLTHHTHGKIMHLEIEALPISSTEVRATLARHESVADLVPEAVLRYITAHQLYQWRIQR